MRNETLHQLRARANVRPRRILLVEDEEDIRELLAELLTAGLENVVVDARPDAASALKALAANAPDVIVTDYKMPDMNGLDFLMHARMALPAVPAILITAFPDVEIAMRAINEARVQSFLQKPVEPQQVVRVVGGVLSAWQAQREQTPGSIRSVELMRQQRLG